MDQVERFSSAHRLAAYLGLVPREFSGGEKRFRGRITKALPHFVLASLPLPLLFCPELARGALLSLSLYVAFFGLNAGPRIACLLPWPRPRRMGARLTTKRLRRRRR